MNTRIFFWVIASAVAVSAPGKDVLHTADKPLPPTDAAASMQVPDGFRVTLFAGEPDVKQPIGFCIDDRARLWVAEAYNYPEHGDRPGDRIVILEDADGDGRFDHRTVFYDKLNYVTGIEVGFGGVWVMSPPCMYFIPDRDGDDVPDGKPRVLLDGFGNHANAHNLANGFAWGPDGWLYGTHGRTNWSRLGKPGTPDEQRVTFDGGVYRYHPIRHVWEPYADGTTNPWGIDWNDFGDAFVCNCVNPHLFQVIQGAHYEPWRGRKSSQYAYQRIDTIADHLHFVGLGNVRNGLGSEAEDEAGGGHAHCGTMIYLGDNFPASYRNQLFTNNIHGRRVNNDLLRRSGSGYVASHGPDLMRSQDPWFMGVTLAYGPGGEVYVSDWSDTGECHSTRNTRKGTGRIYRLTYLKTHVDSVDLGGDSNDQLVAHQLHQNDWFVRHARRLLQERAARGDDMRRVHEQLRAMFDKQTSVPKKLRALWALKVTGGVDGESLRGMLESSHPEIRGWAVTLLCEEGSPGATAMAAFGKLAGEDDSPRVRLSLASAMQRLQPNDRWPLAEVLASRAEDHQDQNLPLMYWYGIEPLIEDDLPRFANITLEAAIPRLRINAARRIASSEQYEQGLRLLVARITERLEGERNRPQGKWLTNVLEGIQQGLDGRRRVGMPEGWRALYRLLQRLEDQEVHDRSIRLALKFDDQEAIARLRESALDASRGSELRRSAIAALVSRRDRGFGKSLLGLLADPAVRGDAIRGLASYQEPRTPEQLIGRFEQLDAEEKQIAIETLASREPWALELLDGVGSGKVSKSDITAFHARQLQALGNEKITRQLAEVWGDLRETPAERARQIKAIKKWVTPEVIAEADLQRGKALFTKHCGTCHRFFGEGGKVGPDITGAQRNNLDYVLENIVDPSASVSSDYRMHVIATDDGRIVTGLIESENAQSMTVLTTTDRIVIPMAEVLQRRRSNVSIMPTGLLESLSEQEIRDLLGYVQRKR